MEKTKETTYERPILTVDVVLLTIVGGRLNVALLKRQDEPFPGREALIGGFIHVEEDADADATAARVLAAKAGLKEVYIEQLRTFSGPDRDPRGWSASISYIALVPCSRIEESNQPEVVLRPVDEVRGLPFDHDAILTAALQRLRGKGAYSTLPTQLLDEKFTMPQLMEVYEQVMGLRLDASSFRRKVAELDIIEETEEFEAPQPRKRPGRLYRLKRGVTTFDRRI